MRNIFLLLIVISLNCCKKKDALPIENSSKAIFCKIKVVEAYTNVPIEGCEINYDVSVGSLFAHFHDGKVISHDSLGLTDSMGFFSQWILINSEIGKKEGLYRYLFFNKSHYWGNSFEIPDNSLSPIEITITISKMAVLSIKASKGSNCSKSASLQLSSWEKDDIGDDYIDWKIDFGYQVNKDTLNNIEYSYKEIRKGGYLNLSWQSTGDTLGVCKYTPVYSKKTVDIGYADTTFLTIEY